MSLRRFGPDKLFVRVLVPSFALALGCSEQQPQRVRLLVAPEAGCDSSREWLLDVGCFQITVCPQAGESETACAQVAPEGAIENPAAAGRSLVVGVRGNTFGFSVAALPNVAYNVEVTAYTAAAGSALAVGQARGVRFSRGGPMVEVMLSPTTNSWTCPGGLGTRRIERAFHQAVALPNGDVLLIGGIGSGVSLATTNPSAALLTGDSVVQVFTPGSDALETVRIEGDAGTFSRALFEARWIAREGNLERIRLFGGVTGSGRVSFLLNNLTLGLISATPGAAEAPVVDVLYNPVDRSISVVNASVSDIITTAVETPIEVAPGLAFPQPRHGVWGHAGLAGRFAIIDTTPTAVDVPNVARRFGTLSRFNTGWLAYGGNTADMMGTREAGRFALVSATGMMMASTFPAEIRDTAFHTATTVDFTPGMPGDEALVFVGGIPISDLASAPFVLATDSALAAGAPVRGVRRVAGAVEALTGTVVDPEVERVFHTATVDARGRIIVVGGTVVGGNDRTRLHATGTAYAVTVDAMGQISQTAIPSLRCPRFGHAATLLPTGRLLVTGGLTTAEPRDVVDGAPRCPAAEPRNVGDLERSSLDLISEPEMLFVAERPERFDCDLLAFDAGPPDAAVMSTIDARAGADAGVRDAGMSMMSDAPMEDAP